MLRFNLNEFERGDGKTAPELQKNDVVIVGKSGSKAFWFGLMDFVCGMFSMGKGI